MGASALAAYAETIPDSPPPARENRVAPRAPVPACPPPARALPSAPRSLRAMLIRFWGTRGSLAKPGPSTLRYGGNTSCVEVRTTSGTLIVLDCGTGAHGLGQSLAAGRRPVRGH